LRSSLLTHSLNQLGNLCIGAATEVLQNAVNQRQREFKSVLVHGFSWVDYFLPMGGGGANGSGSVDISKTASRMMLSFASDQ
jgi:hypothetical protein